MSQTDTNHSSDSAWPEREAMEPIGDIMSPQLIVDLPTTNKGAAQGNVQLSGESDQGRRIEWLPSDKFEKLQFILRLSARLRRYKQLLNEAHLESLHTHLSPFIIQQIPRIHLAPFGYNPRIHKVINNLLGYARIKKLETIVREQELVDQEQRRTEGTLRQTKAQRQLAAEAAKRGQTPLEYILSFLPGARIPIINLEQELTSPVLEMGMEDNLGLGDAIGALEFRPKRKNKKHYVASDSEG
ncbi:hypothetical protein AAG906_018105 [Vitis piasezkii]